MFVSCCGQPTPSPSSWLGLGICENPVSAGEGQDREVATNREDAYHVNMDLEAVY